MQREIGDEVQLASTVSPFDATGQSRPLIGLLVIFLMCLKKFKK